LDKKDLKYFEKRLLEERDKLLRDIEQHEASSRNTQRDASGDLSAYSFHFASRDTRLLYHIDQALERVRRDEYGKCEECGEDIARGRLDVVPHARLCSRCKEEEERSK
jgi:DnaK suppressor protein